MSSFDVRDMREEDVAAAAALQRLAFPEPFPAEYLWQPDHLSQHLQFFPEGQFVATVDGQVIASCSNCIVAEASWANHLAWYDALGGPYLTAHDANGTTLYGVDITVHPEYRRLGIGKAFYARRFALVRALKLARYGTGCRMPDYQATHGHLTPEQYAFEVINGRRYDRTLTPFSRFGLTYVAVAEGYMDDEESGNAGCLWEWTP